MYHSFFHAALLESPEKLQQEIGKLVQRIPADDKTLRPQLIGILIETGEELIDQYNAHMNNLSYDELDKPADIIRKAAFCLFRAYNLKSTTLVISHREEQKKKAQALLDTSKEGMNVIKQLRLDHNV